MADLVSIVMGSDSDLPVMNKALQILEELKIDCEVRIVSAHREPDVFFDYAQNAKARGVKIIIAGAGLAAHLPGMCASLFPLPVIGVPMGGGALSGTDALCSILQMPPGVPVATVGIGNAQNAALLAARILAVSDEALFDRLAAYVLSQKEAVIEKDKRLQEIGTKEYIRALS